MESHSTLQLPSPGPDLDVLARSGLQPQRHEPDCAAEEVIGNCTRPIVAFLLDRVPTYAKLAGLRRRGWENRVGDRHFQNQRRNADKPSANTSEYHFRSMKKIGKEINRATSAFTIKFDHRSVLDFCVAPGGFLKTAEDLNPGATFVGFSLPPSDGGHSIQLSGHISSCVKLLDITMLGEDMGMNTAEINQLGVKDILPRHLGISQRFALVICDGNVLRTHKKADSCRTRESLRLQVTQLALGLEHLKPGGTMVILFKKVESWDTLCFINRFDKFSSIKLYKPRGGHETRSSFYLIASDVQSKHPEALLAITKWKSVWRVATFGTEKELAEVVTEGEPDPKVLLEEIGATLIEQGKDIWLVQARALGKAPFTQRQPP